MALLAALLAFTTLAPLAPSARAQEAPPDESKAIVTFPQRDMVTLESGFLVEDPAPDDPNIEALTIQVLRKNSAGELTEVGKAQANPDIVAGGFAEVNHPGGVGWQPVTPDIIPGDVVRVSKTNAETGEAGEVLKEETVYDVSAEAAQIVRDPAGDKLVVKGTSGQKNGARIPVEDLEQRIINPDMDTNPEIDRRDIRADSTGGRAGDEETAAGADNRGFLRYDVEDPNDPDYYNWTATYTGLGDEALQQAVAGQTRVLTWRLMTPAPPGEDEGERVGITIYEEDEINGPGMGESGPLADRAVKSSTPEGIGGAFPQGMSDLVLSGVSHEGKKVTKVSLTDQNGYGNTVTATSIQQTEGSTAWEATFSGDQRQQIFSSLRDGTLVASAEYVSPDAAEGAAVDPTIGGAKLRIAKDTTNVPGAPKASVDPAAEYNGPQKVILQRTGNEVDDPRSEIRYEVGNTPANTDNPTDDSHLFTDPLYVTANQTIKAVVVDSAGNVSPVSTFDYQNIKQDPSQTALPAGVSNPESLDEALPAKEDPPKHVEKNAQGNPLYDGDPETAGVQEVLHEPIAFPSRDFFTAEGYRPNTDYTVRVYRGDNVIGTARGTTDDTGFFEVNHPGGVCWTGSTPDIRPNDRVEVSETNLSPATASVVNVAGLEITNIEGNVASGANSIVVKGTAQNPDGSALDQASFERLEQRIIAPDLTDTDVGRRDLRSPDADTGSTLTQDGINFTATYTNLTDPAFAAAMAGEFRVLSWKETGPNGDRLGMTIYEYKTAGGPGMGGCAAEQKFGVTGADRGAINAANSQENLKLYGVSSGASEIRVNLGAATAPGTLVPAPTPSDPNAQTWSATIPAAAVGGLADSNLTASATFDGVKKGVDMQILKDVKKPEPASKATPSTPATPNWQAVTVDHTDADPNTKIHYTLSDTQDGKATSRSRVHTNQIFLAVQNGKTPYINTVVVDGAGNVSDQKQFPDSATVAGAPTNVTAVAGDASAKVSWTAPTDTGGSPITGYEVDVLNGTNLVKTQTFGNVTSGDVTGLTNGTAYTFKVRAINAQGASADSVASTAVTPATVAGAPTIGTAVASNASARVNWTAPTDNGGSPITGYRVRVFQGTSTTVLRTVDFGANATSGDVTGLTNGTAYTFRVLAINAQGASATSARSNSVTPAATVASAPTIGTAYVGNASARVNWTAPTDNGGSPITGYRVRVFQGTSTTVLRTVDFGANATSGDVTGLTNGTAYTFRVLAINAQGASAPSARSNSVTPYAGPGAPRIGTAASGVSGGTVTATANWRPPTNVGGSAITAYRVKAIRVTSTGALHADQPANPYSPDLGAADRTYAFAGLVAGASYKFEVQTSNTPAQNRQWSPVSARSNTVTAR